MPYQNQPGSLVVLSTFVQIPGDIAHLNCGGVGTSVSADFSWCFGISYQHLGECSRMRAHRMDQKDGVKVTST
jgi:hypothetical protein